jgi:hypothetical protein
MSVKWVLDAVREEGQTVLLEVRRPSVRRVRRGRSNLAGPLAPPLLALR